MLLEVVVLITQFAARKGKEGVLIVTKMKERGEFFYFLAFEVRAAARRDQRNQEKS